MSFTLERLRPVLLLPLLSLLAGAANAQFSSGVLGKKMTVELKRTLPPVTDVHGKTAKVDVERDSAAGGTTAELQSLIENLLTRSDSAVRIEDATPDLVVTCRIAVYNRPRVVTSTDSNKVTTERVIGSMSVAFRITEPRSGHVVTSGVASKEISQELSSSSATSFLHYDPFHKKGSNEDANAKSALSAENVMVGEIARQIASYLVNTQESITVMMATNKSLEGPDKLAVGNLWSRALEEFETQAPNPDARVDAYRIYNIGVANEALAYQAQDETSAVKYLQLASTDYGKAIAAKGDEKYFIEPQDRIRTALAHYQDLHKAKEAAAAEAARSVEPTKPAEAPLTDEDVVQMVQNKMDDANILDNIQSAAKINFDLSIAAQTKMTHEGVTGKILMAMKARAKGASASAPPPPPAAAPKSAGNKTSTTKR